MHGSKKRVQSTNDSSILSKYSMVKASYFKDDFLKYFVIKDARRSPLIHRGYYIRMRCVDHLLRTFLSEGFSRTQVLSLGAGFDTSFFRLKAEGIINNNCKFFEVDYPEVVKAKKALIQKEPILYNAIGKEKTIQDLKFEGIYSDNYILVGCSLEDLPNLENILFHCNVDVTCPTLLLSEVVLCYLNPISSSAIIRWSASLFDSAVFVTYEQVFPGDPFGLIMTNHFNQVGSPLRSIHRYPSPESQVMRYLKEGWPLVKYQNMVSFQTCLASEELSFIQDLEIFDEFEEWDLKCIHYIVLTAFKGSCQNLSQKFFTAKSDVNTNEAISMNRQKLVMPKLLPVASSNRLLRYGHSANLLAHDCIIVFGGFGECNGKHMRLTGIDILQKVKNKWQSKLSLTDPSIGSLMFHTATVIKDNLLMIFGGRTSPYKPSLSTTILKFTTKQNHTAPDHQQLMSTTSLSKDLNNHNCNTSIDKDMADGSSSSIVNDDSEIMCNVIKIDMQGSAPCPRWRHTATRINDGEERVLIFGGRTTTQMALNDCYILKVSDFTWEKVDLEGEVSVPRHSHTACLWNKESVILAGGLTETSTALSLVQHINVKTMTLETLNVVPSLLPRYSHTCHIINDRLILIGGVSQLHTYCPSVAVVSLVSLTWSSFVLPVCPGRTPLMLHNHSSVMLDSEKILVFGGGGNCFSFGTHFNSEPLVVELSSLGLNGQ